MPGAAINGQFSRSSRGNSFRYSLEPNSGKGMITLSRGEVDTKLSWVRKEGV